MDAGFDAGTFAVNLDPGVGTVELNMLDVAGWRDRDLPLAALLKPLQDLILNLHLPGVVVFAALNERAADTRRQPSCRLCQSMADWRYGSRD